MLAAALAVAGSPPAARLDVELEQQHEQVHGRRAPGRANDRGPPGRGEGGDYAKICTQLLASSFAGRIGQSGRTCPQAVEAAVKDADTFDMTVSR